MQTEIVALAVTTAMIVLDYLTGIAKAVYAGSISSGKMREGLWHKFSYVIVVVLAEIIEHAQTVLPLGFDIPLVVPAAVYIILTEIASILENLTEINPGLKENPVMNLFRKVTDND